MTPIQKVQGVDLHAHYLAPSVVRRIQCGEFKSQITADGDDSRVRFMFPTSVSRWTLPGMVDLDDRIHHLDECGVSIQILSTWIDMFGYDLDEDAAVAYHTRVNEGLAEAVAAHPDRLRFFASVPLPWGDAAAAVLDDAVTRLDAVGSMIGTNVQGSNLDDPRLDPFWLASQRLNVPVELHPVNVAGADRLARYELGNFLGNPFDTTIAASSLIFGGALDRYPRLNVILLHGGGYLPYAAGRLTHGWRMRRVADDLREEPLNYLTRFYFDTVVFDPRVLKALVGIVGIDRLVLGTDYPFDMEPPDARAMVEDVLGHEALGAISENAARILSVGSVAKSDPATERRRA